MVMKQGSDQLMRLLFDLLGERLSASHQFPKADNLMSSHQKRSVTFFDLL